jgi:hypothetical protein
VSFRFNDKNEPAFFHMCVYVCVCACCLKQKTRLKEAGQFNSFYYLLASASSRKRNNDHHYNNYCVFNTGNP